MNIRYDQVRPAGCWIKTAFDQTIIRHLPYPPSLNE
jgi:hypothetical protein